MKADWQLSLHRYYVRSILIVHDIGARAPFHVSLLCIQLQSFCMGNESKCILYGFLLVIGFISRSPRSPIGRRRRSRCNARYSHALGAIIDARSQCYFCIYSFETWSPDISGHKVLDDCLSFRLRSGIFCFILLPRV